MTPNNFPFHMGDRYYGGSRKSESQRNKGTFNNQSSKK